jgi:hypothetical protein
MLYEYLICDGVRSAGDPFEIFRKNLGAFDKRAWETAISWCTIELFQPTRTPTPFYSRI